MPCGLLPGSQGKCGGSAGPVCGCLGALKTVVGDRTFWGSNPSGCPARLTSPPQSHLGPAVQIKPLRSGGCEDAPPAGLSRYPARHDGVWTGPIHVLPAPSGLPTVAASMVQHGRAGPAGVVLCEGSIKLLLAAANRVLRVV